MSGCPGLISALASWKRLTSIVGFEMKAFEFQTCVNPDGTLSLPAEIASQLQERSVRVLVLVKEADEDADWAALTTQQFLKGYGTEDAAYDHLPAR